MKKISLTFLMIAALLVAMVGCEKEEETPVTPPPTADGNGDGTGTGNDGGEIGDGDFVEETLTFTINDVNFVMKPVRGGTFWMGAQNTDPNEQNYDAEAESVESPVHKVTLSSYYMSETEVTQALWYAVMRQIPTTSNGNQWSEGLGIGDDYPAYYITWDDIQGFLTALNAGTASQRSDKKFALSTEAQWEFAARGGNKSKGYKYAGSNNIGDVAWYDDVEIHPVKGKSPNELGLYDMSGNIDEWCSDWFGNYGSGSQRNPTGASSSTGRVLRGGNWGSPAKRCRVSDRGGNDPSARTYYYGFRLVLLP